MTNALIKLGEQAIAPVATSTLSSLVPSVASKVGADVATKAGADMASKALSLGLSRNAGGNWLMDTTSWPTGGTGELKNFIKPILGEDTPSYSRFLEQIGEGDYKGSLNGHTPGWYDDDGNIVNSTLDNIEGNGDILPKIYGDNREATLRGLLSLGNRGDEAMKSASVIANFRGKPNEMATIYRQAPKDINYGDWVGLTDSYANLHEGNSEMNKLWSKEVPANEVYFAGDDINEWYYMPKEVQLDDDIAKALDKAMGYAKQKMNIPVKMTGDYPDDFSRIPVRFTDKEIDTLHKYTGKIPELYHQTTASSLGDMTLDRRQAVSGDSGMPEGIFLKENDEDIGLMGKHQLALNAKMENPAYFKDRADLDNFMRSRGAKDLMSRRNELDDYYQKLADEAEKKQHELAMIAWDNPTPENKALADQAMNDWQRITEEWTKAIDENGEKAREGIRNTLVNNGYDSAIIENDAGSGGRSVKSYIVFDKNQLSPRYKEGMSFDPNDAQSVFNEASKRQKNLDDVMSQIADKITSAGDKAVYKSGGNKSIESMTNKVARKMAGGRDYRLLDMKDHMRGAVFLQDLNNEADEITTLLEEMQYALGQALDIEAIETDLGYTGLHLTWRDDDGLGYEIQVTTPEIWDTKKASDKIYDEIRNWTESELRADPKKQAVFDAKVAESKKLWSDLWSKLGRRPDLKPIESFNDDMYFY